MHDKFETNCSYDTFFSILFLQFYESLLLILIKQLSLLSIGITSFIF